MKQKLSRGLLYVLLGFVVVLLLRLGYGYLYPNGRAFVAQEQGGWFETAIRNYASEKMDVKGKADGASYSVDQKYEKVASLQTRTRNYDEDEKKVRVLTTKYNALVQFEQNYGLPGARRLNLAIGVPPVKFDDMVAEVKTIGKLSVIRIDKTDKTNEYKDLNAKRVSLDKTRTELAKLKAVGGSIEERINLENRLLEIESEIQGMGVRLGEYDAENEFCTVKFGLEELSGAAAGIPFLTRLKVAMEWTIKYYAVMLATALTAVIFVWLVVLLLERFKLITNMVEAAKAT